MNTQLTTIESIVEAALAGVAHQLVVHQGRCVDAYLDLYAATDDLGLRWSITQRLDEIRYLSLVDVAEFRADLEAILAIATGTDFAVPTTARPLPLAA
jgi:hypothetical protein